jgi:hypothetical protein
MGTVLSFTTRWAGHMNQINWKMYVRDKNSLHQNATNLYVWTWHFSKLDMSRWQIICRVTGTHLLRTVRGVAAPNGVSREPSIFIMVKNLTEIRAMKTYGGVEVQLHDGDE